jgi:alkanesulfonate monooxygenase SsuD/methylene tetrahydromethanopterin reductase-like flavin-dependent oxidoreductase (luciferase family)
MAVGTPEQIREQFSRLADEFGIHELVISTFTDRFEDRLRSYELMASIFELSESSYVVPALQAE